jgi:hypothetical protein
MNKIPMTDSWEQTLDKNIIISIIHNADIKGQIFSRHNLDAFLKEYSAKTSNKRLNNIFNLGSNNLDFVYTYNCSNYFDISK